MTLPDDIPYLCGDCGEERDRENVDLVQHEREEYGELPICNDKPCRIENASIMPTEDQRSQSTNHFKVDRTLE